LKFQGKIFEDPLVILNTNEGRMKYIIQIMQTDAMKTHPNVKYGWENHKSENNESCRSNQSPSQSRCVCLMGFSGNTLGIHHSEVHPFNPSPKLSFGDAQNF
jgi:hypothetical protein